MLPGQMSIFDLFEQQEETPKLLENGQTVYLVIIGEIVEYAVQDSFNTTGSNRYHLYGKQGHSVIGEDDIGESAFTDKAQAIDKASRNLISVDSILLNDIQQYQRWEYIRDSDQYKMIAEVGTVGNCVYVKEWYCYQFAIPFETEKERDAMLKEYINKITKGFNAQNIDHIEVKPESNNIGARLYWSNSGKRYADAKYVEHHR